MARFPKLISNCYFTTSKPCLLLVLLWLWLTLLFKMAGTHYKRRCNLSSWYRRKKTKPHHLTEAKKPEVSGLLTIELILINIYSKELQSIEVLLWLIITFCLRRSGSSIAGWSCIQHRPPDWDSQEAKIDVASLTLKGSWLGTVNKQNCLRYGSVNSAFLGFELLSKHASSIFSIRS